jgi:hypothetical protein
MLAQGREGLPLFMGMALAILPTNGINPSRHFSTNSLKRTFLRWSTNWPSRANPCCPAVAHKTGSVGGIASVPSLAITSRVS